MATTKQQFIDSVNANLADGSGIQATEHRDVLTSTNGVTDLVYGDVAIETSASPSITTPSNVNNVSYDLTIQKTGRSVTINGILSYESSSNFPLASPPVFTISNTAFQHDPAQRYRGSGVSDETGESIRLDLSNNVFRIRTTLGVDEIVEFSFTYNTQN